MESALFKLGLGKIITRMRDELGMTGNKEINNKIRLLMKAELPAEKVARATKLYNTTFSRVGSQRQSGRSPRKCTSGHRYPLRAGLGPRGRFRQAHSDRPHYAAEEASGNSAQDFREDRQKLGTWFCVHRIFVHTAPCLVVVSAWTPHPQEQRCPGACNLSPQRLPRIDRSRDAVPHGASSLWSSIRLGRR